MRGWIAVFVLGVLFGAVFTGCDNQEYGQCAPPADHLQVLFKPKNPVHPFSHSFCVVCHNDLSEADYAEWVQDMGGSGDIGPVDGLHPCLYVYGDGADIESLAECQSLICEGGAAYNDMVSKEQGNIDVTPILLTSDFSGEEAPMPHAVETSIPLSTHPNLEADDLMTR